MKTSIKLVFSLAMLWAINATGQSITGIVIDSKTNEPIPYITVKNFNKNSATRTDQLGNFNITAQINKDSILISGMGYIEQKVIAVDSMIIKLMSNPLTLSEVVISTNREAENRSEAPVAISSIKAATIEENKPTSIDQVLNQTAGVYMVDLGNEQHTMSIRRPIDYGASYLYLEDGIPIRSSGVFNHNALLEMNMANVNRIEIIKGPASSIYGGEAIGGAVNFITKQPTFSPTAGISVQGNNLGYKRTDFYASNTLKQKVGFRLSGYYADQDNTKLEHSDFNKLALSLSANYFVGKNTEFIWSNTFVDYYSDMSGSLDSADFYSKSYGSNQTFTHRKVKAFRTKLSLVHEWNDSSKTNLTGYFRSNSIGQNPSYRIKDDYKPWTGQGDPNLAHGQINKNSFNSYGAIIQHKQDFKILNSSLIAGASIDYSPNTYEANYIAINKNSDGIYDDYQDTDSTLAKYKADILNPAVYLQYKLQPIKNLNIILGARYDYFQYGFNNNLDSNAYTAVTNGKDIFSQITPKIGATYQFSPKSGTYINYSQGFVPPQVTALYVGNDVPSLRPVYYDNYEFGGWTTVLKDKAKIEVSIYRMDGKDEIISVLQNDGSRIQENAGKTRHQGIEYTFITRIKKDIIFRVSGTNASHQFIDYTENGTDYAGKDMPQAPNWILNSQITYKPNFFKGFRISLEWQRLNEYYMDRENTKKYSGYNVFNVRLGYTKKSFELWTNLMNVGNELYATVARSNAWGDAYSLGNPFNFNVGIAYNFKGKSTE